MIVTQMRSGNQGLRRFDGFTKLADDYRIGTVSGGILSLCALITTIAVFVVQIRGFLNPKLKQMFMLDTRRPVGPDGKTISPKYQTGLQINFQISFPHAPCYLLHFDALESLTDLPLPLSNSEIKFTRLVSGRTAGLYDVDKYFGTDTEDCGPCLVEGTRCCNSCEDVLAAHRWNNLRYPDLDKVRQCRGVLDQLRTMDGEGCRVSATFRTVRIRSQFHIAPGMSSVVNETHFHDIKVFGKKWSELNLTHTIDHLYFGLSEGEEPAPLDGFTSVQERPGSWRVSYRADVMGDEYTSERYVIENRTQFFPGVSVDYDISPIYALEYYERQSLMQLLSSMVISAGGVVFVFRILDATFYANNEDRKLTN